MTFDCGFREYSPGSGLRLKVIEEACDSAETDFVDLGLGGEHHKQRWATATRQTVDVTLARSAVTYLKVAARYHAAAAIKTSPRLESLCPQSVRAAIKRDRSTMKVLLLHPDDTLAQAHPPRHWDLVVDTGRAPIATYERWSQHAGCPVISIYDHAEEIEDLYRLRQLLRLGSGRMMDQWGIDWWEVLSLEIASGLQQLVLDPPALERDASELRAVFKSAPASRNGSAETSRGSIDDLGKRHPVGHSTGQTLS